MVTQKELTDLVSYDKVTGLFTWNKPRIGIKVGGRAGGLQLDGYRAIGIKGKKYQESRLAWLYVHGYFPEHVIDHINRDRADNRLENLRVVSQRCNTRNSGISKNNGSGVTGVFYFALHKRWVSGIKVDYKRIYLGEYRDKTDAVKARWEAEKKYDFPNCNTTSTALEYLKNN